MAERTLASFLRNKRLQIAAAATLGPAAVLSGCGGGDSGVHADVITATPAPVIKIEGSPTATAAVTKVVETGTPVSGGDTSKGPGLEPTKIPTATPAKVEPTATPSPTEVPKPVIPEFAQTVFTQLKGIQALSPETEQAIENAFINRDWPNAKADAQKMLAYLSICGSLQPSIKDATLPVRTQINKYIQQTWPQLYKPTLCLEY